VNPFHFDTQGDWKSKTSEHAKGQKIFQEKLCVKYDIPVCEKIGIGQKVKSCNTI
jgi:hypothetical protein